MTADDPQIARIRADREAAVRAVRDAVATGQLPIVALMLHPYLRWTTTDGITLSGRNNVVAWLETQDSVDEPAGIELRDGQVYRWRA